MKLPLDKVYCLDFEASAIGRGSYPIEVAVVDCHTAEVKSWLIRPSPAWLETGIWSEASAAVHRIPHAALLKHGRDLVEVAAELADHCNGKRVFVDGGENDRYWLTRLYDEANAKAPFRLGDYHAFAWELACQTGPRPDIAFHEAEQKSQDRFSITHRAGDDARCLAEMLRLIAGYP